jgi:hypothetical protein
MNARDIPPLLWSIPDLLCPGAPVVETGESGLRGARGTVVRKEPGLAGLRVWWETVAPSMVTSLTGGTALDVEHPLGRAVAVEWLWRMGEDADDLRGDPRILAWSVHSVYRGGPAIHRVLRWREHPDRGVWGYGVKVECYNLVDSNGKQVHVQRAVPALEDHEKWATGDTAVYDQDGDLFLPPLPGAAS